MALSSSVDAPATEVSIESVRIENGQVRMHFIRYQRGAKISTVLAIGQTDASALARAAQSCADRLRDDYADYEPLGVAA